MHVKEFELYPEHYVLTLIALYWLHCLLPSKEIPYLTSVWEVHTVFYASVFLFFLIATCIILALHSWHPSLHVGG